MRKQVEHPNKSWNTQITVRPKIFSSVYTGHKIIGTEIQEWYADEKGQLFNSTHNCDVCT